MERNISAHPSLIMELTTANEEEEEEEEVYVAVKKDFSEGKSTLQWLLQNTSKELKMEKKRKIIITHVHVPPHIGGIKFPAETKARVIKEYKDHEREMVHRRLEDYVTLCSELKERAETLVIEAVDVAKGLLELVAQHGVAKLVMGAAADEQYSRNMKVLRSRTAIVLTQQADPSCRIWFVCQGNLVCTREAVLDAPRIALPSTSSLGSSSRQSERLRLRSSSQGQAELLGHVVPISDLHRSRPDDLGSIGGGIVATSSQTTTSRSLLPRCRFSSEGVPTVDDRDAISSRNSPSLSPLLSSASDDMLSNLDYYLSMYKDEEDAGRLTMLPFVQGSDPDLYFSSPQDGLEDVGLDTEVYARLQEAIKEAENLRQEAYRESHRRQTAERKTIEALRMAKALEHIYAKEVNKRKDIEVALAREKMEVETLKNQRHETIQQCQIANMQKRELEHQISDSNSTIKDLEEKLQAAQHLLTTLQVEHEESQLKGDAAVREAEELRQKKEPVTTSTHGVTNFLEFSYSEIKRATHNFSSSLKIGEGGYGSVYKGFLQNTIVAIRVLNPEGMQGQSEFLQKVNVLSRIRHPNLVTLIGVCPEAWALIYEFLPNGSLEEHLDCKNDDSPLTWQLRTRIATETCSSLIFLQSSKPYPINHGDLKPDNILLDANLVSKLGDIGICHLFQSDITTTRHQYTILKGTFEYMDPEFLATGVLTPQSDVYSFGIILLRLLTGKPAVALVKKVKDALDKGLLHRMIDPSAGTWPFIQAKQLANLGLRCCERSWRSRPNLLWDVWSVLDPMLKTTFLSGPALSLGTLTEDGISIPNCFICPIFQEIMSDPYIASDGFTYEADAIKGWIGNGHDTSPMTNLKLPHNDLIPNRALRSAIQEWLQQNQQL